MWIQTRKTLAVIGSEINHRLSVNMKKYRRLNQDMPVFSLSFKANWAAVFLTKELLEIVVYYLNDMPDYGLWSSINQTFCVKSH